jgi:hypothetical protein
LGKVYFERPNLCAALEKKAELNGFKEKVLKGIVSKPQGREEVIPDKEKATVITKTSIIGEESKRTKKLYFQAPVQVGEGENGFFVIPTINKNREGKDVQVGANGDIDGSDDDDDDDETNSGECFSAREG